MTRTALALGVAAALASATAYGINIVYARLATLQDVPPGDLVVLRIGLMLALVAVFGHATGASFKVPKSARPTLLVLGLLSAGLGLAYFYAVSLIPIGIATLVFYTFPFLILIASPFVDGTRFSPLRLGLFLVAFAGLVLALGPSLGAVSLLGLSLAFAASAMAAAQFFAASRAGVAMSQVALLFWCHVVMLPIAVAVALGTGGPGSPAVLAAAWIAGLITIVGYLFGFALQMLASRSAPPPVIGLVFCLEPVVAIVGAGIVLGETLSTSHMIGGTLVLAALVISSLMDLRRASQG